MRRARDFGHTHCGADLCLSLASSLGPPPRLTDGGELDPEELQDLQQQLIDLGLCDMDRGYCTTSDFALAMCDAHIKLSLVFKSEGH